MTDFFTLAGKVNPAGLVVLGTDLALYPTLAIAMGQAVAGAQP